MARFGFMAVLVGAGLPGAAAGCPAGFLPCDGIGGRCGDGACCTGMNTVCGARSICTGMDTVCGPQSVCTGMGSRCGPGSVCQGMGTQCDNSGAMPPMAPMPSMAPMPTMAPFPTFAPFPPMAPMPAPSPASQVYSEGCDMGTTCQGRSVSMAGGVAFCCPAACPHSCSMSSSQTDDVLTSTCACPGGYAAEASPRRATAALAALLGSGAIAVGAVVFERRRRQSEDSVVIPAEALG